MLKKSQSIVVRMSIAFKHFEYTALLTGPKQQAFKEKINIRVYLFYSKMPPKYFREYVHNI